MTPRLRLATAADAGQIRAIYAPIVRETAISFELEPPSVVEVEQRILGTLERFPWIVCERDGAILGYAYAWEHRARAAYQWSVDVSVHVDDRARRSGVGRALYPSLLPILGMQGFCNAYAGIALPNPGSVGLHEALGFRPVGIYRGVGYKLGMWHDVGWWELAMAEHPGSPAPPTRLRELANSPALASAMAVGQASMKP